MDPRNTRCAGAPAAPSRGAQALPVRPLRDLPPAAGGHGCWPTRPAFLREHLRCPRREMLRAQRHSLSRRARPDSAAADWAAPSLCEDWTNHRRAGASGRRLLCGTARRSIAEILHRRGSFDAANTALACRLAAAREPANLLDDTGPVAHAIRAGSAGYSRHAAAARRSRHPRTRHALALGRDAPDIAADTLDRGAEHASDTAESVRPGLPQQPRAAAWWPPTRTGRTAIGGIPSSVGPAAALVSGAGKPVGRVDRSLDRRGGAPCWRSAVSRPCCRRAG